MRKLKIMQLIHSPKLFARGGKIILVISAFLAMGFNSVHAQDITTGLIGHWKFDEGSGTTAADSSGNNNTGTLTNGPTWTTGKIGNAINLDGTDDSVSVPSSGSLTIPSDITTSAWIYKSSNSGNDEIMRSGSEHRFKTNGDEIEWTYAGGDDYHITSNVNLQVNRWYHVVSVFNNTANTVVIYVDSVAALTKTENQSATFTGPLYIGKEISAASFFHGRMDDLRLYNRALSASEIQTIYNLGSGSPPPADTTAPIVSITAPTSGSTVSGTSVIISANASDNVGVAGVQFKLDGANLGAEDTTSPYSITWNSTTASNGSHTLTATARDAAGNITTSSGVAVMVNNTTPPPDIQAPTTPTNLIATAQSSSQINLSWTASTDNVGVTGYRVERCQGSTCTSFSQVATPSGTSYNDTGLIANTTYRYQVRATDAAGNLSGYSSIVNGTTLAGGGGGIPAGLGWYQIPNTQYRPACPPDSTFNVNGNEDCFGVVGSWTGGVYDTLRNKLYFWGGGHAAYYGNEVYALDMNTLSVSRLYDPSTSPNLQGATGSYSQMNDGRISSRHNYNHNVYIPTLDKVYTFGGSTPVFGSFINDTWLFDPATLAWSQQTTTGPTPAAAFGMNANWDPNRNLIWIMDDNTLYSYDPATRVYTARGNHNSSGYRVGFLDSARKYYWRIQTETGAVFRVSIDPSSSYVWQQMTPTGDTSILTKSWMGVVYDPVGNQAVMWDTGSTVYTMNLDTFVITANTLGSTIGPNKSNSTGTSGRWRYDPLHGVFVVVNHPDVNAYSFRLSSGTPPTDMQAPSVPISLSATAQSSSQINISWSASTDNIGVTGYRVERCQGSSCTNFAQIAAPAGTTYNDAGLAANTAYTYRVRAADAAGNLSGYSSIASGTTLTSGGGGTPEADFQARCSAPGVVKCLGFDNASDYTVPVYPNDGPYPPGGSGPLTRLTRDTSNKSSGAGSARFEVVSGTGENPSGSWVVNYPPVQAGQTFYVQFRQRFDPNMINNKNLFGGGGWKQIIMHSLEAGSCAALEVTMNNGGYRGFPRMYTDCGQGFLDFYSAASNDQVLEWSQPYPPENSGTPGVDYWCLYNKALANDPTNRCAFYQPNQWMTFYYQITVGSWGQPNSIVRAWAGYEGQPLKLVINYTNKVLNKESVAPGFNRLTLTNYDTGRCTVGPCVHPTAYTWYDELIVSTQPIAAPGATPPTMLVGDLNGDRTVNGADWSIMAGVWFTNDATADINKDGVVNSIDFSLMNQNWGRTQ